MEPTPNQPHTNAPTRIGKAHHDPAQGRKQPKPAKGAPRGRGRKLDDVSALKGSVARGTTSGDAVTRSLAASANVFTSAAVNLVETCEFKAIIEKDYKIHFETSSGLGNVSGELHLVPWGKYTPTVDGLVDAAANVLNLPREKIRKESEVVGRDGKTARPAFRLIVPRVITEDEKCALEIAFQSFRQHLRGQDPSLADDLFAKGNPEAAKAGRSAAEGVRRRAGGRDLPEPLSVSIGPNGAQQVELKGKIGCHPESAHDEESFSIAGEVIGIQTEDGTIEIRAYDWLNKEGQQVASESGKKFLIKYSKVDQKADALNLPLGQPVIVKFEVIPRIGGGHTQLILNTIPTSSDSSCGERSSSTSQ